MKQGQYVTLISTLCIISWFLWGVVLFLVAPEELGFLGIIFFLATFGASIFTSLILILHYIRIKLLARGPVFREFHIIVRESALFTLFFTISLWILHVRATSVLNFLLLFLLVILIDVFFIITYDQRLHQKDRKD